MKTRYVVKILRSGLWVEVGNVNTLAAAQKLASAAMRSVIGAKNFTIVQS